MTPREAHRSPSELYDSAPCGLLSTANNGMITRVNRTFATWMGYRADELVGAKRLQDLLTMGCKIFHQTHWMPLLQMQGSVSEVQLDFVRRDGSALAALVNAATDPGEGCCDVAVFVATDRRKYERELLLARKRAEELLESEREAQEALELARERLRLALDSAQLLVWDIDLETGAARYEPGVEQLLGLEPGAVVTAAAYRACIDPADREAEQTALVAALSPEGSGYYRAEYRLLGRDGKERAVSSSGRAFFDSSRRLAGFAGVLQDVTPWRAAEKVLREQEREAQQRAILAETLIGIVSHDLRTPLHAVLLGANSLVTSGVTATQARTLNRVVSAANRANRLIADLLDFTQARLGGGLPLARVELDLHAVVADCVEELKLAWSGRMIEHVRRGDGVTFGDPDRLAQVVTNLASNALTYGTPERPVIITSLVGASAAEILVHNEGPPIPPELIPHIFEPLRRGEQQVKLGSRSVGLGLYIVRQIADAHGGRVTVSSGADGTTFAVTAPRDTREPGTSADR
jgi:sigma-B regulation protein RsbU (phosphoserine phosphatase)